MPGGAGPQHVALPLRNKPHVKFEPAATPWNGPATDELSTKAAAGCRATDARRVVEAFAAAVELLAPASVALVAVLLGMYGRAKLEKDDAAESVPFNANGSAVAKNREQTML
jgi:hypothetical protein